MPSRAPVFFFSQPSVSGHVPLDINILTINLKLRNNSILQRKIHVMLGLIPPEVTPEDEECNALLNETLYSDADNSKPLGK